MDVKEKLVELLNEVQETGVNEIPAGFGCTRQYITNERVAAHLISHGVTVQESMVNNTESKVAEIDHANEAPQTNADRIRSMTDEELAEFIRSMVDESNSHNVACYGCINYGTHHSDPANKGTYLYECDGCENEGIGLDVLMWLQQPAEKPKEVDDR